MADSASVAGGRQMFIAQKCRDLLTNPLFVQQIAVLVFLGNGNGVIDFPEFCKFYLPLGSDQPWMPCRFDGRMDRHFAFRPLSPRRHLRKNGGEVFQLSDMYRGIRNVSVRRRVSGADA